MHRFIGDYLDITDENSVPLGKYCGYQTGREVIVGGEYAAIIFHSSSQYKGFKILFSAVNPSKSNRNNALYITYEYTLYKKYRGRY